MKKTNHKWLLTAMAAGLCLTSTGLRADDKEKDYKQSSDQTESSQTESSQTESVQTEISEPAGAEKKSPDSKFIEEASKSGAAEVKLAELAQQKAQSQSVKQYADRLVKDHQAVNQKLEQICERQGTSKQKDKDHKTTDIGDKQKVIDRLSGLSGQEFDKTFLDHTVMHHQKSIKNFEKEASEGEDPAIRSFARETLPTLQEHLRIAQMLKDNPNASLPISEPAGAEPKSDAPSQETESQQDQPEELEQQQKELDQQDQPQGTREPLK